MSFKDKNVLVSGGSRGIGRAISQAFASAGARVAVNYRNDRESAEKTLESLTDEGHVSLQADISRAGEVSDLLDACIAAFGTLDILVNNAGIGIYHPIA